MIDKYLDLGALAWRIDVGGHGPNARPLARPPQRARRAVG